MKLHIETLELVKEERRITGLVIGNLQKISDTRLYLQMGYSSMFDYCTRGLGYSESCAYRRISAVKLSAVIPEIRGKLDSGELNLTNLSMAQSFFARAEKELNSDTFDLDSKKKVLAEIQNCSKRQTEEILNQAAVKLGITQGTVGDEAVLHLKLKKSTVYKLDKIRSLRSHKNPNMSYSDLIEDMCEYILTRIDLSKTKVRKKTKVNKRPRSNSRYIPNETRRAVWQRDQGQCTYLSELTRQRCGSNQLLQIDHINPFSHGGPNSLTNLRLLCHAHHRLRDIEIVRRD